MRRAYDTSPASQRRSYVESGHDAPQPVLDRLDALSGILGGIKCAHGNLPALPDAAPRERERTSTYLGGIARRRMRQRGDTILDTLLFGLGQALKDAFDMFWEVLWPLVLGFALSAIVQALVSHRTMARLLGSDSPCSLALATLFGIASSSCSYAAVALARAIFRKGASFTAAMVFELASTNLVIELGIILVVLMGWPFAASEFLGGLLMVLIIALLFRLTLTPRLVALAREHADRGMVGWMEGHASMDMSVQGGSFLSRLLSGRGFTAVSGRCCADRHKTHRRLLY